MKIFFTKLISFETVIRMFGITVGTLFSPTWPLLHLLLDPYMNLSAILAKGITPYTFLQLDAQVHAIPVQTIVTLLIPGLLGCLIVNIGFIYLCGRFGVLLSRYLSKRFQTAA